MEILPLCETARYVIRIQWKKIANMLRRLFSSSRFMTVTLFLLAYSCKKLTKANGNVS